MTKNFYSIILSLFKMFQSIAVVFNYLMSKYMISMYVKVLIVILNIDQRIMLSV
ncbi:MAG: hypothetical protein U0T65_01230 [Buchnera aphidicola (Nurudea yanoniella)]